VASGGGHFVQLRRLRPAWQHCEVHYASTIADYAQQLEPDTSFWRIGDANRNQKFKALLVALHIAWLLIRLRPDVVISTGAAPGYFALRFGKLIGARTIWIDSIANAEELSMTGRMVRRYADLWLTQWPHLAHPGGPAFMGSVL
jgi:UDP-N-acetylglucosamine:LPS N-acetylglucosamine transferase